MNILLVGCGKVGSRMANYLSRMGHDVSIVDRDPQRFDQLDDDFSGMTVAGIPIDQDVLSRAGILGCDALAALSDDDNVNIMVSQLAREIFHVPQVIARIYDPRREDVFSHFGLKTICPTNLTVEAVYSMLMDTDETKQMTFDSTVVGFDTIPIPNSFVGMKMREIPVGENESLFGLLHSDGRLFLAGDGGSEIKTGPEDRLVISRIVD